MELTCISYIPQVSTASIALMYTESDNYDNDFNGDNFAIYDYRLPILNSNCTNKNFRFKCMTSNTIKSIIEIISDDLDLDGDNDKNYDFQYTIDNNIIIINNSFNNAELLIYYNNADNEIIFNISCKGQYKLSTLKDNLINNKEVYLTQKYTITSFEIQNVYKHGNINQIDVDEINKAITLEGIQEYFDEFAKSKLFKFIVDDYDMDDGDNKLIENFAPEPKIYIE